VLALQQIDDALEFGVGVVEVRGEADVFVARSVEPEGGHDSGGFHLGVEVGHVGTGFVEGDDAALVFGRDIGVQDGVAFFFDGRDEPVALAQQLAGDVLDADFQKQLEAGSEADQANEVGGAGLVTAGVGFVGHFFISHEIGASDVVPTVDDGTELVLDFFAHEHGARSAGAEHPFVGVGSEEVDVLDGGWEGAEGLNGIHTEQDAAAF